MGQGAYIFGCSGTRLTPEERGFFRETQPWGFILFARNIEDPAQLAKLTSELRDAVGRDAPILIDQEGGRVERMTAPHWRTWLPALDHVATAPDVAERSMFLRYALIAHELRAVGIDVNCAPVCDVATPQTHPILLNRCYGFDGETVARIARAVADGLKAGGVLPVMKHMPGLGRGSLDSHLELPKVDADLETLQSVDFAPFNALSDLPMGMSAHIVYSALEDGPATTSAKMIGMIRNTIGFGGLLLTDDISMQALRGTLAQRSRAALTAGCDMVLHCNGVMDEMIEVAKTAKMMGTAAQTRADAAMTARPGAPSIDIDAAEAELRDLMDGKVNG